MMRLAKIIEIPMILAITKACAKDMIRQNIFQWNEQYPSKDAFENDIKRNELYVFISDGTIIGCMVSNEIALSIFYYEKALLLNPDDKDIATNLGFAQKMTIDSIQKIPENRLSKLFNQTLNSLSNQYFYQQRGYKKLGNIFFPNQSEYPFYCYELVL